MTEVIFAHPLAKGTAVHFFVRMPDENLWRLHLHQIPQCLHLERKHIYCETRKLAFFSQVYHLWGKKTQLRFFFLETWIVVSEFHHVLVTKNLMRYRLLSF